MRETFTVGRIHNAGGLQAVRVDGDTRTERKTAHRPPEMDGAAD